MRCATPQPDLNPPPDVLHENIADDRRLYRLLWWGYLTLLPYTALFSAVALLSRSSTMVLFAILGFVTLAVQSFNLYAMRRVVAPNPFALPFGAGKLEDFSAFLCGVLFIPSGLYMGYIGSRGLVHPKPVLYGFALVPVVVSIVRELWLYIALQRLKREAAHPPLLLHAQMLAYRIAVLSDLGVLVAFGAAWLLTNAGDAASGERIDPLVTLILSLYSVWSGVALVRRSFRPLMDLPLPESEQLAILRTLARHYADYEDVGLLFTRASGRQRFILVDVAFPERTPVAEVERLRAAMEQDLAKELPGLMLTIRPLVTGSRESLPPTDDKPCQTGLHDTAAGPTNACGQGGTR